MSLQTRQRLGLLMTLAVFAFYFFLLEGVALDYWDTYIAAPATFIAGQPCRFIEKIGGPAVEYPVQGKLPQDLIGKDTYGIVSKDQRIGAGVVFAPAYLAFGVLGFRLLYAAFGAMAFFFAYLVGRKMLASETIPFVLGLLVSINPFMAMMNRLNANFITVAIMAALLALLLDDKPRWLLIGLVYGALGGIRNEAIMMVPALCLLMLATRDGRRGFGFFALGSLIGIAPYLAWNQFAFGKMLIHSSQFSDFEGWRPTFPHEIFAWRFEFNGLFNWPFHDRLVRTPHYPFPTYLTLPLVLIRSFGWFFTACFALGLYAQWKLDRRLFGFFVLWIVFCLGLFLFQENWEEPKTTFGALVVVPLGVLMARGLEWLLMPVRGWQRWIALVVLVLVLKVATIAVGYVQVPVDERWYVRFPKAKVQAEQIGCLPDEQRREWMFFHTDECPSELIEQRVKLTGSSIMPLPYYPVRFHADDIMAEWGRYRPDIFDIWQQIYGY